VLSALHNILYGSCRTRIQSCCSLTLEARPFNSDYRLRFSILPNTSHNHFSRTPQETPSSIVKEACLLVRYLAVDVLIFRAFPSAGMCLPSRCLAMDMHVIMYPVETRKQHRTAVHNTTWLEFIFLAIRHLKFVFHWKFTPLWDLCSSGTDIYEI
jgi:hypothetical protein